jgi:hypothetical protein
MLPSAPHRGASNAPTQFVPPLVPADFNNLSSVSSGGSSSAKSRVSRQGKLQKPERPSVPPIHSATPYSPEDYDKDDKDDEPDFKSANGVCAWDSNKLWKLIKSQAYNEAVLTYFPPFNSSCLQNIVRVAAENYIKDSEEITDSTGELIIS